MKTESSEELKPPSPRVRENISVMARTAFAHYGTTRQFSKLQEECSTTIIESLKFARGEPHSLLEAVADLKIILAQIEHALGENKMDDIIQQRLVMLKDKIRQERSVHGQKTRRIGSDRSQRESRVG